MDHIQVNMRSFDKHYEVLTYNVNLATKDSRVEAKNNNYPPPQKKYMSRQFHSGINLGKMLAKTFNIFI